MPLPLTKRVLVVLFISLYASKFLYDNILLFRSGTASFLHLGAMLFLLLLSQIYLFFGGYRLLTLDSCPIDYLPLPQVAWHTLFASLSMVEFFERVIQLNGLSHCTLPMLFICGISILLQRRLLLHFRFNANIEPTLLQCIIYCIDILVSGFPWLGYNTALIYYLWNHANWSYLRISWPVGVYLLATMILLLVYVLYHNYDNREVACSPEADAYLELALTTGLIPFLAFEGVFDGLPYNGKALLTGTFFSIFCATAWKLAYCIEVSDGASNQLPLVVDALPEDEERSSDDDDDDTEDFSSDEEDEEDPLRVQKLIEQRLKFQEALLKYRLSPTEDVRQCQVCTICLDALVPSHFNVKLPACGHVFHSDCLTPWALKRDSCPSCRGPLFQ